MKQFDWESSSKKSKYDWFALKLEFFRSAFKEVKGFFEEQYGTYNGRIKTKTTGWAKEKERWQKETAEAALSELKARRTKELADCLDLLLVIIGREVKKYTTSQRVDSRDVKIFWEILRCENGLPSRIIQGNAPQNDSNFEEARRNFDQEIENSI